MLLENMKINYKPLVLVNTLFNIVSYKTDIEGYWVNDGKLYIDNIELINYPVIDSMFFMNRIHLLFSKGEKCVFYKNPFNEGIIQYPNGEKDILKRQVFIAYPFRPNESDILKLLKTNEGLTVYKINDNYLIEIYKQDTQIKKEAKRW